MNKTLRTKSPRAPSIALDEAIDRAIRIYEKERRHPAPVDVIAQNLGYKNASNGAALQVLASLRYYGLVEKPKEGFLAVTKEVEEYKFAPSEPIRKTLLLNWLKAPVIFTDLLEKYQGGLPSDATLKFDLIQMGFLPLTADGCLKVFRRSVDYARHYDELQLPSDSTASNEDITAEPANTANPRPVITPAQEILPISTESAAASHSMDRIPVRLSGGRRAWIEVPVPFFELDKARLKNQIDLILTDDEDTN